MSDTAKNRAVAEDFSGHRFADTYQHLARDVTWTAYGDSHTVGRDAVVAACEASAQELGRLTTEFLTFRTVADGDTVAIETVGRYLEPDGQASYVASCDLYDFVDGLVTRIVSYAVEIADPRTTESGR
jgi:ketosteroid isomerase-like protein